MSAVPKPYEPNSSALNRTVVADAPAAGAGQPDTEGVKSAEESIDAHIAAKKEEGDHASNVAIDAESNDNIVKTGQIGAADGEAVHSERGEHHSAQNPVISPLSVSDIGSDDQIAVDSNLADSDADSGIGSTIASSTISLRSSIYEYIEENGRTYHAYKAGAYHIPNDEPEQERLDLQHHLFRMTMDGALFAAPVTTAHNVLDIATGTGIWAIEFAEEFPGASVIGTDLSPIQPVDVPPNCQFLIEDCEEDWVFSQKFDFIHGRALLSCFSNPKKVVASIFDALVPGTGYFELQDICFPSQSPDGTLAGTNLQKWQDLMVQGLLNLGKDFGKVKEYGNYMRDAGFMDVVETKYTWAIGPWIKGKKQKMQATWWMQNFLDGMQGWSMAIITRGMGWQREEVDVLLAGVREDVKNWRNVHAYFQMYVVYGRKP